MKKNAILCKTKWKLHFSILKRILFHFKQNSFCICIKLTFSRVRKMQNRIENFSSDFKLKRKFNAWTIIDSNRGVLGELESLLICLYTIKIKKSFYLWNRKSSIFFFIIFLLINENSKIKKRLNSLKNVKKNFKKIFSFFY